nr:uncharacterized protein LOC129384819 [Dermacentor andersoni]
MEVVSFCGVKNHGKFRVSQFSSTPHESGRIQSGIFYFPLYLRFIFPLDLSPRLALLLVLHSCFQLRSSSVPSVPLHYCMVCAPKNYFGHEHHLFQERLLLLLHSLACGGLLLNWTCFLALHYNWCLLHRTRITAVSFLHCFTNTHCVVTGSAFLFSTAVINRTQRALHYSVVCAPKNYFGHEHHLFQERLLLLLHSLASGVLLVDWTCLLALHYSWFCIPVFNCGPQAYPACPCTALVCAPKDYFRLEHHLFQERLLLLRHSLVSGVLLVDSTCLLAQHYYG